MSLLNTDQIAKEVLDAERGGAVGNVSLNRNSMRDSVRINILRNIIRGVRQRTGEYGEELPETSPYLVLILDYRSTHIINAAFRVTELSDEGLALIESLEKNRQPFPDMDAIYIIEPTPASIARVCADFVQEKNNIPNGKNTKKPGTNTITQSSTAVAMYRGIYVFLTRKPLDESVLDPLKTSKMANRVRYIREANIDFIPFEADSFHFSMPASTVQLYNKIGIHRDHCLHNIVESMLCVCAQLNEYPFIRFQAGNELTNAIAQNFQGRLDTFVRESTNFWWHGDGSGKHGDQRMRATLIFLDRRDDPTAPLLHEFTYQALIYDIFDLKDDTFEYEELGVEGSDRSEGKKTACLNENDPLWVQFRHLQIKEVLDRLQNDFNEYQGTSAGRLHAKRKIDLEEMANAVRDIPIYKELMSRHVQHFSIAKMCMDRLAEFALFDIAQLEQTFATGVNEDAKEVSSSALTTKLVQFMKNPEYRLEESMRLFALYVIAQKGIKPQDRQRIIESSDPPLSSRDQDAIINMSVLGVAVQEGNASKSRSKSQKRDKKAIEHAKNVAKAATYHLSRYTPKIKNIIDELCSDSLDKDEFPYIFEPPPMPTSAPVNGASASTSGVSTNTLPIKLGTGASKTISLRKHGLSAPGTTQTSSTISKDGFVPVSTEAFQKIKEKHEGGRVIVYVIGGMTYSETRAINELVSAHKKDIVIGSTHILRPNQYIDALRHMEGSDFNQYIRDVILKTSANGGVGLCLPVVVDPLGDAAKSASRQRTNSFLNDIFGGWKDFCGCCQSTSAKNETPAEDIL